jgi:hypothetical protein
MSWGSVADNIVRSAPCPVVMLHLTIAKRPPNHPLVQCLLES